MNTKLTDFIETQEIMNNLGETLAKIYQTDPSFNDEVDLPRLTEKTYEVMQYLETVQEGLLKDPGVVETAKKFKLSTEDITSDIMEVIMMATIARQMLHIADIEED